jgi:cytidine deaminase
LAGSDDDGRRWPQGERRGGTDRRAAAERRIHRSGRTTARVLPADAERRIADRRSGRDRRDEAAWQRVVLEETAGVEAAQPVAALVAAAAAGREYAHAAFSAFKVGAALETADGRVITGANIESASYGLTICAERVALVKALTEGHAIFTRIAVVADTEAPTPPCGACRQLLWEYCGDIEVVLGNLQGPAGRFRLSALLPLPFDRRLLE